MIRDETPERMLRLIRLGHPCEKGEPYNRADTISEFRRRGREIFMALDWPMDPDSMYKNRYTGHEQTLAEMHGVVNTHTKMRACEFDTWFDTQCVFIVEHWWPIQKFQDTDMFAEYKIGKLTGWECTTEVEAIKWPASQSRLG